MRYLLFFFTIVLFAQAQIIQPGAGGGTPPGGTPGAVQYNNSGSLGGSTGVAYNSSTIGSTIFYDNGGAFNDCVFSGSYTGTGVDAFYVTIDTVGATDTFSWSSNLNAGASGIPLTGLPQLLTQGVSFACRHKTGHTQYDEYDLPVKGFATLDVSAMQLLGPLLYNSGGYYTSLLNILSDSSLLLGVSVAPKLSGGSQISLTGGYLAGNLSTGNGGVTGVGYSSLGQMTHDNSNIVAVGNNVGGGLTDTNQDIIAVGPGSAFHLGSNNHQFVAVGSDACNGNNPNLAGDNQGIICIGYESLYTLANNNTFITAIGYEAMSGGGLGNISGAGNDVAIGTATLQACLSCLDTTAVGTGAGQNAPGSGNVFLGKAAGANETGSNKLYIANTNTATPLIKGDFSAATLFFNARIGATLHTPASSSEACISGQFTDDANYHYVCTATNTWKRVALSGF